MLCVVGDKVLTCRRRRGWAGQVGVLVSACVWSACAPAAHRAQVHPSRHSSAAIVSQDEADTPSSVPATGDTHLSQSGSGDQRRGTPATSRLSPRRPTRVVNVTPQDIEQAKRLLDRGLLAYQKGDYDAAEGALAQSMALYPFLAEAHLTLGKIYLMRGSANRDQTMIDHAQLMFQMAHAVDPNLRETDLLLQLFLTEPLP